MSHHTILRIVCKFLLPCILLFALYVQFHGDLGPGGGFQAGVIFGVGFILYAIIFGLAAAQRIATPGLVQILLSLGVLIYAGVGVVGLLRGGRYLNYSVLAADPVEGQHLGILLVEIGVGVTVSAVMICIFYAFAGRGRA